MARRNKQDELLAELVDQRYRSAANARSSREVAWKAAREAYDPAYVDKLKVKRAPYVKTGYLFNAINHKTAQVMAWAESNGTWVRAKSTTRDSGDVGEKATNLLERQFRMKAACLDNDNDSSIQAVTQFGLLFGSGPVHARWFDNGDSWGIRLDPITPDDHYVDWRHGRWHIVRRLMTLAELSDEVSVWSGPKVEVQLDPVTGEYVSVDTGPADGGKAIKAFKILLKQVKSGVRTSVLDAQKTYYNDTLVDIDRVSDTGERSTEDDGTRPEDDPFNVRVEVLSYFETREDGIIGTFVPSSGSGGEALCFRRQKNPYGVCPISTFDPLRFGTERLNYGYGEVVSAVEKIMDYMLRSQLRLVAKKADAPILHRKGARIDASFLRSPSGKAQGVSDIQADVRYLESTGDQGIYAFALQLSKQVADTMAGMSDQKRGIAGTSKSATDAALVAEASSKLDGLMFRNFSKFVEHLAFTMLSIIRVHMTEEKLIPWVGRDTDELMRIRPEHLKGSFEVEFGGSAVSMNVQQELAALQNFATLYGSTGVVDLAAVARIHARKIGQDPNQLLLAKDPGTRVSPKHENVALFDYDEEISVHPDDDDLRHLKSHQEAQAAHPGHPAGLLMQRHMQEHMQSRIMKLIAQQQKGGAPVAGGQSTPSGPATPGTAGLAPAGSPGQPAVDAPALAGLNDQRNASNEATPGAAPGPGLTPNRLIGGIQ